MIEKDYIRHEIVEELVQRMKDAIDEVVSEHEYITPIEIIVAGAKIGFVSHEEEEEINK